MLTTLCILLLSITNIGGKLGQNHKDKTGLKIRFEKDPKTMLDDFIFSHEYEYDPP